MTPAEIFNQTIERRASGRVQELASKLRQFASELAEAADLGFHGLDLLSATIEPGSSRTYCEQKAAETLAAHLTRQALKELTP